MPATQAHVDNVHAAFGEVSDLKAKLAVAESRLKQVLEEAANAANMIEGDVFSLATEIPIIVKQGGQAVLKVLPTLTSAGS